MATASLYLERPKDKNGKLKDSEVSITVKITIDRENRFGSTTKEKITPKYWDFDKQCVKSNYRGAIELNHQLNKIKSDLIQLWRDNKNLSMAELKVMADNIIHFGQASPLVEKKSALDVLKLFIKQYQNSKDNKTVKKYEALQVKLGEFNPKLTINNLDFKFYDSFKDFLFNCPNPLYPGLFLHKNDDHYIMSEEKSSMPVGLFDDTVYKYFILLKTFLKWAKKREYEVNESFKDWEIIKRKYQPISLTLTELEKLEALEVKPEDIDANRKTPQRKKFPITWGMRKAKAITNGRDFLALECRTGQRISDLKRFSEKNYSDFKWTFYPKKGNRLSQKQVTVYFQGYSAPALWILERHNFQLPKISDQRINKGIKKACELAKIDQEITIFRWAQNKKVAITGPKYEFISTHTGRKTFITIALQFMTAGMVMELTGIESFATLDHYKGKGDETNIVDKLNTIQQNPLIRKAQ